MTTRQSRVADETVVAHLLLPSGSECKRVRSAAGLSQEALARKVGTTAATISRYETGARSKPRGRILVAYYDEICRLRELIDISRVVNS